MTQKRSLLTADEIIFLQQIGTREGIDGQRARALLALARGVTQVKASEQAGLTKGQLQYALRQFRGVGLAFFPGAVTDLPQPGSVPGTDPETGTGLEKVAKETKLEGVKTPELDKARKAKTSSAKDRPTKAKKGKVKKTRSGKGDKRKKKVSKAKEGSTKDKPAKAKKRSEKNAKSGKQGKAKKTVKKASGKKGKSKKKSSKKDKKRDGSKNKKGKKK